MTLLCFFVKTGGVLAILERLLEYQASEASLILERMTELEERMLRRQERYFMAFADVLSEIEQMQMGLVKVQSAMTKRLFPDYVPSVREEASEDKGYHELYMN